MLNVDELIMQALKSDDEVALRSARNLKSEILKFKTAKNAKPYTESEELNLIKKMCSRLEESIKQYSEAGRLDLLVDEENELRWLKKFLPEPVKESQIYEYLVTYCITRNWVDKTEPTIKLFIPKKSMGIVIKDLKSVFPTADGKMISDIVKENIE